MRVPHAENAEIDIRKLTDYLLDPEHSRGRNKAALWQSALGIGVEDAVELRRMLIGALALNDATLGLRDRWGQRYTVDFRLEWRGRSAIIRTGWIIADGSRVPKSTTAFPR